MPKIIRVHGNGYTVDQPVTGKTLKAPQVEAYYLMREGVWVGNRLYPPSTITFVELVDA